MSATGVVGKFDEGLISTLMRDDRGRPSAIVKNGDIVIDLSSDSGRNQMNAMKVIQMLNMAAVASGEPEVGGENFR